MDETAPEPLDLDPYVDVEPWYILGGVQQTLENKGVLDVAAWNEIVARARSRHAGKKAG